jgi:hypothetical protein
VGCQLAQLARNIVVITSKRSFMTHSAAFSHSLHGILPALTLCARRRGYRLAWILVQGNRSVLSHFQKLSVNTLDSSPLLAYIRAPFSADSCAPGRNMRVTEIRINMDLERGVAGHFNSDCMFSLTVAKDPDSVRI